MVLLAAGSPWGQDAVLFGEAGQKELLPSLPDLLCANKMPGGQHLGPLPPPKDVLEHCDLAVPSPVSWGCAHALMFIYVLKGQTKHTKKELKEGPLRGAPSL